MDPKIMFGIAFVCCTCISLSTVAGGFASMGSSSSGTTPSGTTPAVTAPPAVAAPPPAKYKKFPDYDFGGNDIECSHNVEASACESKCDANDKCVSYIHTANDKLCCIKHGTGGYQKLADRQITGYIKNIDGYEVKEVGDRPAGDIQQLTSTTLSSCKSKCNELGNCIGFNFSADNCWIKKSEGISPTYVVNGYQFYSKKSA